MDIKWLESLLLGLVSGATEFMPVSSSSHEALLLRMFGVAQLHPLMNLAIHIGIIIALLLSVSVQLNRMQREYRYAKLPKRRRKRVPDRQAVLDMALIRGAIFPVLLIMTLCNNMIRTSPKLHITALFLFMNGILLYLPQYLPRGNKDSRHMSKFDSLLLGIVTAIGTIPGFSRIGFVCSAATARGADALQAYKWALFLSIPAIAVLSCFDIVGIFITGLNGIGFLFVLQCILSGACAYLGAVFGIKLMRSFTLHNGFSGFSYYCWGAALFMFILYLI